MDKIGNLLGRVFIYVLLIGLIIITSVFMAGVVNRLLLWGFPVYGC